MKDGILAGYGRLNPGDNGCKTERRTTMTIRINKNQTVGKIKPMHCINNAPSFDDEVLFETLTEAGIPYSRLHDTFELHYDRLVDVQNVFPDFDADENDPGSYDFAFTDVFIKNLVAAGVKPFYRLGVSIENYRAIKPYNIFPPKDFRKWANICEHIIMHYNEGWADGFRYDIEYWEIWNEPDNFPDAEENQMWTGDAEEYLKLYATTAKHLKNRFPSLKIGGYGSCGFYAILEENVSENANVSSRTGYFLEFFERFLKKVKSENAPLDFFSWHSYSGAESNIKYAEYCRKKLDEYGFGNTESILNEWNPGIMARGTINDSAAVASNMLALQNSPLDMLMYYDTKTDSVYCGLYNPLYAHLPVEKNKRVFDVYYVFKAFNQLYGLKNQAALKCDDKDVYAVAAYDGENGAVMITNASDKKKTVRISGVESVVSCEKIMRRGYGKVSVKGDRITLLPFETALVKFK